MKEFSCTIKNPTGIDTLRAGLIVKIAKNYDDTVVTIHGREHDHDYKRIG